MPYVFFRYPVLRFEDLFFLWKKQNYVRFINNYLFFKSISFLSFQNYPGTIFHHHL